MYVCVGVYHVCVYEHEDQNNGWSVASQKEPTTKPYVPAETYFTGT